MKTFSIMMAVLCSVAGIAAHASEMDQDISTDPVAVVVRVDNATNTSTIFKANNLDASLQNDAAASKSTLASIAKPENIIGSVTSIDLSKSSELDHDKSTQAWFHYYWGNYRGNYWGNYWAPRTYFNYYYNPYSYYGYNWAYSYNWGGYRWHWYWRR